MDHAARPPRETRTGRVIAAVVVWLVVGAMVTVLTTWCGILATYGWSWTLGPPAQTHSICWPHSVEESWPPMPELYSWLGSAWSEHAWYLARPSSGDVHGMVAMIDHRGGWPFRSLYCWETLTSRPDPATFSQVRHGTWTVNRRRFGVEFVPVFPFWPGFALNTLFYAAIAWVLWRIPILLRRQRRRARNLCVNCAYDRVGLPSTVPCPECGHPSAASA